MGDKTHIDMSDRELLILIADRQADHDKLLKGNGQRGLLADVAEVKAIQTACPARNRKWVPIVAAVIAALALVVSVGAALT